MKNALKNKTIAQEKPYATYLPYLLLISCFLVYCNTLNHGFVLDDEAVISKNLIVQKGFGGLGEIFSTFYWKGYWASNAGLYRPLSLVIFAIEWTISPEKPFLFHFVQVLLYVITVFALHKLLVMLLGEVNKWLPFSIALVFALHPLHSEVVANIKSLDEVLALLFFILATIQLLKKNSYNWQSCLYLFLALLSKEGAVSFLAVWLLLFIQLGKQRPLQALKNLWPMFLVAGIWLVIRTSVINSGGPVINYTYQDNSLIACNDWIAQKLTAITVLGRGILHFIYPVDLSYDYSYPQIPCENITSLKFWASFVMLSAMLFTAVRYFRSKPIFSFGILFFFITSILTSNLLFNIGATMADRFMFTPILGLLLAIGYVTFEFGGNLKVEKSTLPVAITMAIALALAVITYHTNTAWKSNDILFSSHVKHAPNSARAQYNYGTILLNYALSNNNDSLSKAFDVLSLASKLDPNNADIKSNLGISNYHLTNYPKAVELFNSALSIKKDDQTKLNLADAYLKLKKTDSAVVLYQQAMNNNVYNANSHVRIGASFFAAKQFDKAAEMFRLGANAYPENGELWLNYGNALAANNQFKEAIPIFEKAFQVNPSQRLALYYIAVTYHNLGDDQKANAYMQRYQTGN